jgi:hypothetical protein
MFGLDEKPDWMNGKSTAPAIEFVRGNNVRGRHMAWTDYSTGRTEVAVYDQILENCSPELRETYRILRDALHEYLVGHEKEVELAHQPQSEIEHGRAEAAFLDSIRGTLAHEAGVALHKKRLREGRGDVLEFSRQTGRFYAFRKDFAQLGDYLDLLGELIDDIKRGRPGQKSRAAYLKLYAEDGDKLVN